MKLDIEFRKWLKQIFIGGILILLFIAVGTSTVLAAETVIYEANTLQEIGNDTQIYEKEDETSAVIGDLKSGTPVIVIEDCTGEWCKIKYKSLSGYIRTEALSGFGGHMQEETADNKDTMIDNADKTNFEEEIQKEFEKIEAVNHRGLDEYEQKRKNKIHTIIFGSIMGAVIAAMFAAGIISALRKKREGIDKGEQ